MFNKRKEIAGEQGVAKSTRVTESAASSSAAQQSAAQSSVAPRFIMSICPAPFLSSQRNRPLFFLQRNGIKQYSNEEAKQRVHEILSQFSLTPQTIRKYVETPEIIAYAKVLDFFVERHQLTEKISVSLFKYRHILVGLPELMLVMEECGIYDPNFVMDLLVTATVTDFTRINAALRVLSDFYIADIEKLKLLIDFIKHILSEQFYYAICVLSRDLDRYALLRRIFDCETHAQHSNFAFIINLLLESEIELGLLRDELYRIPDIHDSSAILYEMQRLKQDDMLTVGNIKLLFAARKAGQLSIVGYIPHVLEMIARHAETINVPQWMSALERILTEETCEHPYVGLNTFFAIMQELNVFNDEFLPYCTYRVFRFFAIYEREWIFENREQAERRFRLVLDKAFHYKGEVEVSLAASIRFGAFRPVFINAIENDFQQIGGISRVIKNLGTRLSEAALVRLCSEPEREPALTKILLLMDNRNAWSPDRRVRTRQLATLVESSLTCALPHLRGVTAACALLDKHEFKGFVLLRRVDEMLRATSIRPIFMNAVANKPVNGSASSYLQNALAFCKTVHLLFQWQRQHAMCRYLFMNEILPWVYTTEFPGIEERKALASILRFPCEPVEVQHRTMNWADYSVAFFNKDKAASPDGKSVHEAMRVTV